MTTISLLPRATTKQDLHCQHRLHPGPISAEEERQKITAARFYIKKNFESLSRRNLQLFSRQLPYYSRPSKYQQALSRTHRPSLCISVARTGFRLIEPGANNNCPFNGFRSCRTYIEWCNSHGAHVSNGCSSNGVSGTTLCTLDGSNGLAAWRTLLVCIGSTQLTRKKRSSERHEHRRKSDINQLTWGETLCHWYFILLT